MEAEDARTASPEQLSEKAREILRRWQGLLRLSDWDIELRVVDPETNWRKRGDVKIDTANRMAIVLVRGDVQQRHLEELVIHELLHIRLYALDQMIEELMNCFYGKDAADSKRSFAHSTFMEILESTTEDLTKALMDASGSSGELSFRRLEREVEQELRNGREAAGAD